MGLVYVINSSEYNPISFGDNYLYHQYDKISSFLLKNYGREYQEILAKPVLNNGMVNWHANHDMQLSRIGDLNQDTQLQIKKRYWKLKNRLDKDINDLEYSSLPEKKKWGAMLRQVFDDSDNMILSDGDFWCLLWGWKFKNKTENYLAPEFLNPDPVIMESSQSEETPQPEEIIQDHEPASIQEVEIEEIQSPLDSGAGTAGSKVHRNNFWYKLKRFFRNFVYRYWGLLFFILLVLFIFCLVQKFTSTNCPEIHELNKQLDVLNEEINNRCL